MPQVASDPVVQRPLRPESLSGRAGAPAGEPSGSFETLLDRPAAAPRTARPERASRARPSDRGDRAEPANDRNEPRIETPAARDSSERVSTTTDKQPADTPNAPQATNGQPSETGQPVLDAPVAPGGIAPASIVDFTAIVEAVAVDASDDVKPETTENPAGTADPTLDGGNDAGAVAVDAETIDIAAAVIVAVAAPAPAVAVVADPGVDPTVAPVEIEATAPAIPADAAKPSAPALPAAAPDAADTAEAPAKPQTIADVTAAAPAEKAVPSVDSRRAAAPNATSPSEPEETTDAKPPAPAERTAGAGKPRSEHPNVARNANAQPHSDAPKPATDAAEQPPKAVQHPSHQQAAAEHASPAARAAVADARPELPATAAAPAQLNAATTPAVPFNLAVTAATPLPSLWPVTALRADAAADSLVPVAGLAVEIVARTQDGLRRFEIRLDPPELGRIDVRLDVDSSGKVTSRLMVERTETLDLLRRDAPALERALQHAGLNTEGGLEFSLRDQNFANRDQAPREVPTTRLIVPDDESAAAEAARRGYGRLIGLGGGIDIRV